MPGHGLPRRLDFREVDNTWRQPDVRKRLVDKIDAITRITRQSQGSGEVKSGADMEGEIYSSSGDKQEYQGRILDLMMALKTTPLPLVSASDQSAETVRAPSPVMIENQGQGPSPGPSTNVNQPELLSQVIPELPEVIPPVQVPQPQPIVQPAELIQQNDTALLASIEAELEMFSDNDEVLEQPAEVSDSFSSSSSAATVVNWREGKKISQMMAYAFDRDEGTCKDVTFYVGPEQEPISAHRVFLSAVSSVFDRVLNDIPAVRDHREHLYFTLQDETPRIFRLLMKHIYVRRMADTDFLPISDCIKLLSVAKKFELHALSAECMTVLRSGMDIENAAEILDNASRMNEQRLAECALNFIFQNASEVFMTDGFLNLSLDSLCSILENDRLNAEELHVFNAAKRWAEHSIKSKAGTQDVKISSTDITAELGRAIYLIRFPIIPADMFSIQIGRRDFLGEQDTLKILLYRLGGCLETADTDTGPYSRVKRVWGTTIAAATSTSSVGEETETSPDQTRQPEVDVPGHEDAPPRKVMRLDSGPSVTVADYDDESTTTFGNAEPSPERPSTSGYQTPGPSRKNTNENKMERMETDSEYQSDDQNTNVEGDPPQSGSDSASIEEPNENEEEELSVNPDRPSQRSPMKDDKILSPEQEEYIAKESTGENSLLELWRNYLGVLNVSEFEPLISITHHQRVVINVKEICPLALSPTQKLKRFHIDYLYNAKSVKAFRSYLNSLNPFTALFFCNTEFGSQDVQSTVLWNSIADIHISVNGLTILSVDHENDAVTLSRLNAVVNPILTGLKFSTHPLRRIHLEEVTIDSLDLLPTDNLEILTLRRIKGIKDRCLFLRKCKNLVKFSCDDMGNEWIDLGLDLGFLEASPSPLKRMALGKARLHCSKPLQKLENSNLEELYLDNCSFSSEFASGFNLVLPKLKKFKICRNVTVKLLLQLFEIETLEWVWVWDFTLPAKKRADVEPLIRILNQAGLGPNRKQLTFSMKRDMEPSGLFGEWKGTKLKDKYAAFTKLDYEQFDWSMFYVDFPFFLKLNKT